MESNDISITLDDLNVSQGFVCSQFDIANFDRLNQPAESTGLDQYIISSIARTTIYCR